jgi:rod shape determining protein RodA
VIPIIFLLRQPDLGTAVILLSSALSLFFVSGIKIRWFALSFLGVLALLPVGWNCLHDYQQKRILVFLNPELDPLRSGYHILQSKIAIGSGGVWGKGFLQGTQSHLNFLPEKHTDFIFALLCEEWGLVGAGVLILCYLILTFYNLSLAFQQRSTFNRLVIVGLSTTFFIYWFVNMAMVSGVLPVVGIPLPLMSYGGTAMITLLISQGIIFSSLIGNDKRF